MLPQFLQHLSLRSEDSEVQQKNENSSGFETLANFKRRNNNPSKTNVRKNSDTTFFYIFPAESSSIPEIHLKFFQEYFLI